MQRTLEKRNTLAENNIALVHSLAARFRGRGIEYDDLFQAGCVGLLKAAEGFEEERGLKFSTYAVPVILGEIKRIFRDTGPIKVSRSLKETALKAAAIRENFIKKEGYEPTISYIAEKLSLSPSETAEAILAATPPMSLTRDDSEGGESENIDVPIFFPEERIGEKLSLEKGIKDLSREERILLYLRFYKNKTQSETAKILSTTQVQISRRETKIIKKLREKLAEK